MNRKLSSRNGIVKCYQVTDTNNSTQLSQKQYYNDAGQFWSDQQSSSHDTCHEHTTTMEPNITWTYRIVLNNSHNDADSADIMASNCKVKVATDPPTNSTNSGYTRQLPSTSTITIYYYSAQKPILIIPFHGEWKAELMQTTLLLHFLPTVWVLTLQWGTRPPQSCINVNFTYL